MKCTFKDFIQQIVLFLKQRLQCLYKNLDIVAFIQTLQSIYVSPLLKQKNMDRCQRGRFDVQ